MSLVGNLEDLSLGDIMQIISLSQKSGVLALVADEGSGRIVFQSGLIHAARLKGRPDDLRGLLVGGGLVDGPAFDEFAALAAKLNLPVEETIAQEGGLSLERIDALLRESVESVILEMFCWASGDFSFDVRGKFEPDDPQLRLSNGINAQYLAMEGTRIRDERSRDESGALPDSDRTTSPVDSSPAVEPQPIDDPLETDALLFDASSAVEVLEVDDEPSATDFLVATVVTREDESAGPQSGDDLVAPTQDLAATKPISRESSPKGELRSVATRMIPVVLIDPDVSILEWVKATIQNEFARIHVFQQAEQGLARIRQYLIRGELPVVLISTEIRIDPLSGIKGLSDFVGRLKSQAVRLAVVGLVQQGDDGNSPVVPTALDGVLVCPGQRQLRERRETITVELASELVSTLDQILAGQNTVVETPAARPSAPRAASVRDIRNATRKLQEASSRGEILPVVLDFATELFARVAILIVREERVFAIAGRGIDALEVDPLDSAPPVSLPALESGWIRNVIQSGEPTQGPPTTPADRELLARLGGVPPASAFLGPIESGGSTIAVLYGDQAPNGTEMPDTSGLEVVLHHAGLALDRAALERVLWEADAEKR